MQTKKDKVDEFIQSWELKGSKNLKIKKLKTKDSNTSQSSIQPSNAPSQFIKCKTKIINE